MIWPQLRAVFLEMNWIVLNPDDYCNFFRSLNAVSSPNNGQDKIKCGLHHLKHVTRL